MEGLLLVVVQHRALGHTPIGLPLALRHARRLDLRRPLVATSIMDVAKVPQVLVIQQPRGLEVKVLLPPPYLRHSRLEELTAR